MTNSTNFTKGRWLAWFCLHPSCQSFSLPQFRSARSSARSCSRSKDHPPPELSDRIQFMPYDFLTPQPVKNADVYFFRWIFHNWSDKYCIQILRNHIPALKKGARIVINDNVLPEPGSLPRWREERLRSMDLTMLELQNSRERELEDWAKLFEEADARFRFLGGKQPRGANIWILEAVWEGE
jgi:hypothetical protein